MHKHSKRCQGSQLPTKVRHYNSARHAALAANFIPESVYDSLLESVNKHLPLLHRYLDLRKKVLGLDELKMYDVYTPLSETETALTYEEPLKKAEEVLAIFGEEYSKGFMQPLRNVGLTFTLTKENVQVPTQVVLMIPMLHAFELARYFGQSLYLGSRDWPQFAFNVHTADSTICLRRLPNLLGGNCVYNQ